MFGCTRRDGSAVTNPHKKPRDKAQNRAFAGELRRDRTWRVEPRFDDQFVLIAESFGLTPEEFERKLKVERGIAKLARKFA